LEQAPSAIAKPTTKTSRNRRFPAIRAIPDPLGPLSLSRPHYSPIAADYDPPAATDSDCQPIRRRFPLSYHAATVANARSALRFPRSSAWTPSGVSWDSAAPLPKMEFRAVTFHDVRASAGCVGTDSLRGLI
jgi:hypothetical protein